MNGNFAAGPYNSSACRKDLMKKMDIRIQINAGRAKGDLSKELDEKSISLSPNMPQRPDTP